MEERRERERERDKKKEWLCATTDLGIEIIEGHDVLLPEQQDMVLVKGLLQSLGAQVSSKLSRFVKKPLFFSGPATKKRGGGHSPGL